MTVTSLRFWRHPKNPWWSRVYMNGGKRQIYFEYDRKSGGLRVRPCSKARPSAVADRRFAELVLSEHGIRRTIDDPDAGRILFIYAQAPESVQREASRAGILYASAAAGAPPGLKLADGGYIDVPESWPLSVTSRHEFARSVAA